MTLCLASPSIQLHCHIKMFLLEDQHWWMGPGEMLASLGSWFLLLLRFSEGFNFQWTVMHLC